MKRDKQIGSMTCRYEMMLNRTVRKAWFSIAILVANRKKPVLNQTFDLCKCLRNKQMFAFWVVYELVLEYAIGFPLKCPLETHEYILKDHNVVDRVLPPYLPFNEVVIILGFFDKTGTKLIEFVSVTFTIKLTF